MLNGASGGSKLAGKVSLFSEDLKQAGANRFDPRPFFLQLASKSYPTGDVILTSTR